MLYQNTDRQVDALYTNYPFTHKSTKLVQGSTIPNTMFIDVQISIQQSCGQIYISSVKRTSAQLIDVQMQDTQRKLSLHFQLVPQCQVSFILNQLQVICGVLQCKPQLYQCFSAVLQLSGDSIAVPSQSFVFLPECISAAATDGLCRVLLNNSILQQGTIQLKRNLIYQSDSSIQFAMYPDDLQQQQTRLTYINGVSAADKHIVVKHGTLSDLRVVTKDNIQLLGVTDV